MRVDPYRWRLSGSLAAHLFKATTKQHHRELAPLIARMVPPGAVVFDVGAHAGQYTKLFARHAGEGRVYAFEPGSYARSILRTVVWLHRLANVAIVPMGLSDAFGIDTLTLPVKRPGTIGFGLSHLGMPQPRWEVVAQEIVGLATVDGVVAGLGLDRLDLIKADIEGWEMRLLQGAAQTLERFRPRLMLELTRDHLARAGDRLEDVFALLAAHRYRAFAIEGGRDLVAVDAPREGDVCFFFEGDPLLTT